MVKNTRVEREPSGIEHKRERDLRLTHRALLYFLLVCCLIVLLAFARSGSVASVMVALMWAAACLVTGAFIGFLFCIPRVVKPKSEAASQDAAGAANSSSASTEDDQEPPDSLRVNSNLVEISDWLTKIIVGLGLVNLKEIPERIENTARVLAGGLAQSPTCEAKMACANYAFALALIVAFSVLGFLMGYLYTRLFLSGAFRRADSDAVKKKNLSVAVDAELMKAAAVPAPEPATTAGTPAADAVTPTAKPGTADARAVTTAQLEAAARISSLPEAGDPVIVRRLLKDYAKQFDTLRSTLPTGTDRKRQMIQVLLKMRGLALSAWDQLAVFMASSSEGERLVAITMLQVKPDTTRVCWLIARLTTEKPFLSYSAAEALRRAASQFREDPEKSALVQELRAFAASDAGKGLLDAGYDTSELLKGLLRSLDGA